ncbi:MAG TPA: hypothetical protein VD996_12875 [Chitinophagaceae bacterium]|nr:hypothetical protein [Chitinophagaceae bacterium]
MRTFRAGDSPFTVFIVFVVVYLLTLTSNFTAPHDSLAYLNMLKSDRGLWHPHHLLYHVSSKYWLGFWKMIFPSMEDYRIIESYSSVWGAAVLAMVYIFFRRRFNLGAISSWLCTAVTAFSYGIWFYSVNVEVYMPALFFTMWSLYIMGRKEWSSRQVWAIGVVHSMAILFHQMNILLTPVVLYKIISQRKNIYVFKSFFWYALTGLVLVGGFYFIGGWVIEGNNNFSAWTKWIRGYTETNEYWQPLSFKTPVLASMGFLRTIVGGQFIFQLGATEESIGNFLKAHALQDEAFLVRGLSTAHVWTVLILSLLLGALMLILLVKFLARFRDNMRTWKSVIIPLALYALIYSLYFLFWMPEILEFWLGQCIICWLLLLGTYRPVPRLNLMGGIMAILLFVINYTAAIRPMRSIHNDMGYARVEKLLHTVTENDLVVVENPWLIKEFLEYFSKAHVATVPKEGHAAFLQRIAATLKAGNKVFIIPDQARPTGVIPVLQKEYAGRINLFQKDLQVIWVMH